MPRTKNLIKKERVIRLPISKFVDTKYRDYAVYVLEARGIPSFYDALTPVQRYILKNASATKQKTLSVVGKAIEDGYHHGNSSLEGAINKLARPFGNAVQILEGEGFFGSEVSPYPAAARYTSVKLSNRVNMFLNTYKHLTTRVPDGPYYPFWMDIPLGLTTSIVGIAVGYKTTILPRKLEHIKDYLDGKRQSCKPYFEGFNGTISRYKGLPSSWLIKGIIKTEGKKIQIEEIPPILKYSAALKKLDHLISKYEGKVRIVNNSNTKVDIGIFYTGRSNEEWEGLIEYVNKSFSIVVNENPVFIKDDQVLVYEKIEDYLDDYHWQLLRLHYRHTEWENNKLTFDLQFNEAKKDFIEFVLAKKRTDLELTQFLKKYSKDIRNRLEGLTSRKFTKDEIDITTKLIKELKKELAAKTIEYNKAKKEFEKNIDPTLERGISSKKNIINLLDSDDVEEIDGMAVWDGDDVFDDEKIEIDEIDE